MPVKTISPHQKEIDQEKGAEKGEERKLPDRGWVRPLYGLGLSAHLRLVGTGP